MMNNQLAEDPPKIPQVMIWQIKMQFNYVFAVTYVNFTDISWCSFNAMIFPLVIGKHNFKHSLLFTLFTTFSVSQMLYIFHSSHE